jgi:hypothetical protein
VLGRAAHREEVVGGYTTDSWRKQWRCWCGTWGWSPDIERPVVTWRFVDPDALAALRPFPRFPEQAAGLAFGTAGLHAAGIGLGLFAENWIGKVALRARMHWRNSA